MSFVKNSGWRGIGLAIIVAFGFSATSVLSALAYDGGTNARSVLTMRSIFALVILLFILRLKNVVTKLPPARRNGALACGILLAIYSYGCLLYTSPSPRD